MLAGNAAYDPYAFESIATVTVGAGGSANIEFTSIPSTYTHLQLRLIGRSNRSANFDVMRLRCNTDSGSNYAYHTLYGDGTSVSATAQTSQTELSFNRLAGNNATANDFGVMVIDLLDYKNTNKYKTVRNLGGADNNGSGEIYFESGLWMSTSAITSIKIYPGVGTSFNQYSTAALYGIKGA